MTTFWTFFLRFRYLRSCKYERIWLNLFHSLTEISFYYFWKLFSFAMIFYLNTVFLIQWFIVINLYLWWNLWIWLTLTWSLTAFLLVNFFLLSLSFFLLKIFLLFFLSLNSNEFKILSQQILRILKCFLNFTKNLLLRGIINIIRFENIIFISQIIKHMSHSGSWNMIALSAMPLEKTNNSHISIDYRKKVILIVHSIFILNKLFFLLLIFRIIIFILFYLFACNIIWIFLIILWVIFMIFFNMFRLYSSMNTNKFLAVSKKLLNIYWIKMWANIFLQKNCFVHKKELPWL